jgi:hypothetical protein
LEIDVSKLNFPIQWAEAIVWDAKNPLVHFGNTFAANTDLSESARPSLGPESSLNCESLKHSQIFPPTGESWDAIPGTTAENYRSLQR